MNIFDEDGLILIPAGMKTGKLHSIRPASGVGDLAFVNASVRTRVKVDGMLEMVAAGMPRLDFLSGSPKLLMEPARTNLCKYPTNFGWGNGGYFGASNANAVLNPASAGPEIILNGGFDSTAEWEIGAGWSITGGMAVCDGSEYDGAISQVLPQSTARNSFLVTFTVSNIQSGGVYVTIGDIAASYLIEADGAYAIEITVGESGNNYFRIQGEGYFMGEIDNVSVKKIDGFADPFGGLRAYKLVETATNNAHAIRISNFLTDVGGMYTISCFFKASERSIATIRISSAAATSYFNLTTGQCTWVGTGHLNPQIDLIGGLYRCSITYMATTTSTTLYFGLAITAGTLVYAGNGTSGLFIYGVQAERGEYLSSFIFNGANGDFTIRDLDKITLADLQTKGIISPDAWSLFLDLDSFEEPMVSGILFYLNYGLSTQLIIGAATNDVIIIMDVLNSIYPWGQIGGLSTGGKLCITYDGTAMKLFVDGVKNPVNYQPVLPLSMIDTLEWKGEAKHTANAFVLNPRCFTEAEAIELTG